MEVSSLNIPVVGTIPHARHQLRRSAVASVFSKKAILEAEHIIHECTEKFLRRVDMQIRQDGFAEMRLNLFALTTTIVDDYCVGLKMDLLDDGNETKAEEWFEGISAVTENAPLARQWSWITPLALSAPLWLVQALSPEFGRVVQWHQVRNPFQSRESLSKMFGTVSAEACGKRDYCHPGREQNRREDKERH